MKYDARVDYLKFVADEPLLPIDATIESARGNFKFQCNGSFGKILWGHNKSSRFSHVLTGSELARIPLSEQIEMIELWRASSATFTRLDLAITVAGDYVSECYNHAQRAIGALAEQRNVKAIISTQNGTETVYIGDTKKRGRKGIFRCYRHDLAHDYVATYGKEASPHTRMELEFGRNNAHGAANAIENTRDVHAVMSAYLDFPDWELWQDLKSGTIVQYEQRGNAFAEQHNLASREKWLLEQVAPSFGKLMADQVLAFNSYPVYHEFMRIARQAYYDRLNEFIS